MIPPEILLTSHSHIHTDTTVDRGWGLRYDSQTAALAIRPVGIEVRIVMSLMGLFTVPPGVVCHFGFGFRKWDLSSQAEALELLKSKSAVYSSGGRI
jgi:hypothetical protein